MDNGKPEPSEGRPAKDLRADYVGHATDYASDQDRRWFEDHPGSTEYFRRAIDGEFGEGIYEPDSRVRVVLLGPGARSRQVVRGVTITDPEMIRASDSGEIATLPQGLQEAIEEAARRGDNT